MGGRTFPTFLFILFIGCFNSGDCKLKCYRCLAFDCPGSQPDCDDSKKFAQKALEDFYYFKDFECPPPDEQITWQSLEIEEEDNTCQYQNHPNEATCSLSRFQVKMSFKGVVLTSHGTILGCSKLSLLHFVKKNGNNCGSYLNNQTIDGKIFNLDIEHCGGLSDYCAQNYCVEGKEAIVKKYVTDKSAGYFDFGIIIGIGIFIAVVIFALFIGSFCKNPVNRAGNYSPNDGRRIEESVEEQISEIET